MKRNWLFEAPIDDYLSNETKKKIEKTAKDLYNNPENNPISNANFGQLMMGLPNIERSHTERLEELAVETLYKMYPHVKKLVNNGKIKLIARLGGGGGGRITSQQPNQENVKKAKEVDKQFDERVKQRHIQNALTQGSSWRDGFNAVNLIEDELNAINPRLVDMYKQFGTGASKYYWENTEMLERMAQQATGRVAYCDVTPFKNGRGWNIEAVAPNFPLLMHELVKGIKYYDSMFTLPKEKSTEGLSDEEIKKMKSETKLVGDTIISMADKHKHEIRNMNYGKALMSQLRLIWDMKCEGYSQELENDLVILLAQEFEDKPDGIKEYNDMMFGVFDNNPEQIETFVKLSNEIIDDLLYCKEHPEECEEPEEEIVQDEPEVDEPESYNDDDEESYDDDEDDSDFNPDDWDVPDYDDDED